MQQDANQQFPRELSSSEKKCLFEALPENKMGYKQYREILENLSVIGYGRFGAGNLILGEDDDVVELDIPSAPIFAVANITFNNAKIYVTIHEESNDQVEVDIKNIEGEGVPEEFLPNDVWTYSLWVPGQKAPHDNSEIREIHILKNDIVMAIAPHHKKIWVYNSKSGINHFVPVTNFYNELLLLLNNRDPEKAMDPGRLFSHLSEFTDEQLIQAFLIYNRSWERIDLDYSMFEPDSARKKSIMDIFRK